MAYRLRLINEIKYGQFGAFMGAWRRLDAVMRERGWATARILIPVAGSNNEVIAEFEYPDLATFERENKAFYADPEAFEAFRAGNDFIVQGSSRTELCEELPLEVFGDH